MVVTFVSNYINHHQIPFCEAISRLEDVDFSFIQTREMEEKRVQMGWGVNPEDYPYVSLYYRDKEVAKSRILSSDVVILGWSDGIIADIENERLSSGKLTFRLSERIYREGQWKAISPKGLIHKYREHYKFRNNPVYLLCAGAYVASDFDLIRCYPGKKLKWGYFPDVTPVRSKETSDKLRLLWAGRLIGLKHPEFALRAAKELKDKNVDFQLSFVGDGPMKAELMKEAANSGFGDEVSFEGSLRPADVLKRMAEADIFLFTSNYLEGWGAVVNEAMASGCAVIASEEAGAVPYLIKNKVNGLTYENGSYESFKEKVLYLVSNRDKISRFGTNAADTIENLWNAKMAAGELVRFCREYLSGKDPKPAEDGPMSMAEVLRPAGFFRTIQEDNHLE